MSIELHCTQCAKLIRAPDAAGGRHGKCPYCNHRVYIPMPENKREAIDLAPVDETDEQRAENLRREAAALLRDVAHDTTTSPSKTGSPGRERAGRTPMPADGEVVDIASEVERFIAGMRDSKLDDAEGAVDVLRSTGRRAHDYVQGLILDEMPPRMENISPPLFKGFLKTLLGRLG